MLGCEQTAFEMSSILWILIIISLLCLRILLCSRLLQQAFFLNSQFSSVIHREESSVRKLLLHVRWNSLKLRTLLTKGEPLKLNAIPLGSKIRPAMDNQLNKHLMTGSKSSMGSKVKASDTLEYSGIPAVAHILATEHLPSKRQAQSS